MLVLNLRVFGAASMKYRFFFFNLWPHSLFAHLSVRASLRLLWIASPWVVLYYLFYYTKPLQDRFIIA
jgi:hypothetical protein